MDEELVLLEIKPNWEFVESPAIRDVVGRTLAYLNCGFAVNLSGASGTGKTTIALQVARRVGRPIVFISGDEMLTSRDMAGGLRGYRRSRVIDKYIQSVVKTEDDIVEHWVDSRVLMAARNGFTIVYDEYTRSRPEANTPFLSILQEGIMVLPRECPRNDYLRVDPNFRVIFTSNPVEYSGVFRQPDALRDRMVTIHLDYYDEPTEVAIARAHSGLDEESARWAVGFVRRARARQDVFGRLSTRASVILSCAMAETGLRPRPDNEALYAICRDVVCSLRSDVTPDVDALVGELWSSSFVSPRRGH